MNFGLVNERYLTVKFIIVKFSKILFKYLKLKLKNEAIKSSTYFGKQHKIETISNLPIDAF